MRKDMMSPRIEPAEAPAVAPVPREGGAAELAAVLDTALDAVIRMDSHGVITGWNAQAGATFGWAPAEAIGRLLADTIIPPQYRESHRRGLERFLATGEQQILNRRIEITALHRDGREFPVELTVGPVRVGADWYFTAFVRDVTLRHRAEQAQKAVYRIAQAANVATGLPELLGVVHTIVGELLPAQNLFVALYDEAAGLLAFPYWVDEHDPHPEPRPLLRGLTEYILRTGEPLLVTPEVHRRLAEEGEADFIGAPSLDWIGVPLRADDRVIGVLVVQTYVEDVRYGEREKDILEFVSTQVARAIERQRAQEQLRESETRYRLLFESNPEAMWVYDVQTLRFLAVNDAAIRRYGYPRDEFLAMTVRDVHSSTEHSELERTLGEAAGTAHVVGVRHRRKDGGALEVEIVSDNIGFAGRPARLVLARDVTERRQLEAQLRQAQKMEAVGQLAGGIAHDFNNLLTAILGSAELLLDALPADHPGREEAQECRKAALRAAELTRQLLAYSRRQVLAPRVLHLNEVVAEMDKLLRRLIGEQVELCAVLATDLGAVWADPGQLEQVIVNLAVNARDAMPEGGKLTITTANAVLDESDVLADPIVVPGAYVMLTVCDTGIGMDADTQARAFEPFFTTKPTGKGTGLGLATVYGIVKQSGGYIQVSSAPGCGTTFSLHFPRVDASVVPNQSDAVAATSLGGSETVLLVEDQEEVRALTHRLLKKGGYDVLVAASGPEALRLAAAQVRPIHLLLTDVVMPGMNGRELSRRLAPTQLGMKVLFLSGYPDDSILRHGALDPGVAFLQKPFSVQALARKIREVLDAAVITPRN
jgi:PAS domain S-box-containing protein